MVAGATGIDLFLLVVDAREGPKPQTLEHLRILRLLGVDEGVVAVSKADAADPEQLAASRAAVERLLTGCEIVTVSAVEGSGSTSSSTGSGGLLPVSGRGPLQARRGCMPTARSASPAWGPSSPERCGRGRSRPATACGCCRRDTRLGCEACRCTARRSSVPRRGAASPSPSRRSATGGRRSATRSSPRGASSSPTASTSSSRKPGICRRPHG